MRFARDGSPTARTLAFAVVLVLMASALYFPLSSSIPVRVADYYGAQRAVSLSPDESPATFHTLTVTASNVTALQGDPVNFAAAAPSGVQLVQYSWQFGDGTQTTSTPPNVSHTFANAGEYLVYVQGTTSGGTTYDNLAALLPLSVESSYSTDLAGEAALVDGAVQQNSTTNRSAEADISPGGSLLVANWIDVGPSNPFWTETVPSYSVSTNALPYAILSTPVLNISGIDAEAATFASDTPFGLYDLNFTESTVSVQPSGGTAASVFSFAILVCTGAAAVSQPLPASPHSGVLNDYQTGTGTFAQVSADPGTVYDDPGYTITDNVYQTVVAYNGSHAGPDPSDLVPDLATCVPGPGCQALYGSSLVSSNGDWTFVINPGDTFYNITTGAHYPVWPNDVAFSVVRACLLTDFPYYTAHGSWPLCQALLPSSTANASWDSGWHAPLNSTPSNLLAAITLNDSTYCTSIMMDGVHGNGCITFHTALSGVAWPEFLELIASPNGGSVVSCRWVTQEGYGLPGWEVGSSCNGAPPSTPPGPTAWDSQELVQGISDFFGSGINTSSPLVHHAVGSGPYALGSVSDGGGEFQLISNPYWGGTTCTGGLRAGCLPAANHGGTPAYIGTVNVFLNATGFNSTQAVLNGSADIAGFTTPLSPQFISTELRDGVLQLMDVPTIYETQGSMNMAVNLTAAQKWTSTPLRFPSNLMTDLDFRQFLIHSFPTPTLQSACIVDGVQLCFQDGGAIPAYMSPYYPSNISWFFGTPDTNPTDVGGAAWWWSQTESDGLDGAVCTTSTPCTFPLVGFSGGVPSFYSIYQTWGTEIRAISQGAVDPVLVPGNSTTYDSQSAPGRNGMVLYEGAWGPDYFDPSDYVEPFYLTTPPIQYLAWADSLSSLTTNASLDGTCAGPAVNPTVTTACEGTALSEMQKLLEEANGCGLPSCSTAQRALLYNMGENIAESLGLYANSGQTSSAFVVAPWIDTTTVVRNPFTMFYGIPFYYIAYRGSVPIGYPLVVSTVSDPTAGGLFRPALVPDALATPVAPTLEAGETIVLSVSAAGGSGVYHFDWLDLPPGCASTNAPFVVCSPNGSANVTVSVQVTDSVGDVALSGGLSLGIVPHVELRAVTASPSPVILGQPVTIEVNVTGGLAPVTFSYVGLPPGCKSNNTTKFTCSPTATGSYAIVAEVVDRIGLSSLASVTLVVSPAVSPTPSPATGLSLVDGLILGLGSAAGGFLIGAVVMRYIDRRARLPPKNPSAGPVEFDKS